MTTQEKREAIRKACIAANPEIVELKQGCFVEDFFKGTLEILAKYEIEGESPVYDFVFRGENEVSVARSPRGNWEILGREIALADVLLAMSKKTEFSSRVYGISTYGGFYGYSEAGKLDAEWNLKQPLSGQSDEVVDFIYELI